MWTTRELRGEIVDIRPETEDASTIVIRPSTRVARPLARAVPADRRRDQRPPALARLLADLGSRPSRGPDQHHDQARPRGQALPLLHAPVPRSVRWSTSAASRASSGSPTRVPRSSSSSAPAAASRRSGAWSATSPRTTRCADAKHIHCCRDSDDFIFGETLRGLRDQKRGYELDERHSEDRRADHAGGPRRPGPRLARPRGVPLRAARDARGDEGALGGRGRPRRSCSSSASSP